jgi:DEAD/DEAH box helicase domain-containing protein
VKDTHFDCPCLYVYDQYPGGIGLSEGFLRDLPRILAGAAEVVEQCPCGSGCPSCIGPPEEEAPERLPLDAAAGAAAPFNAKAAVRKFLSAWLASSRLHV